jgi:hypothetical protein
MRMREIAARIRPSNANPIGERKGIELPGGTPGVGEGAGVAVKTGVAVKLGVATEV